MQNFDDLNLSATLKKSLAFMKYSKPTPIQAQAIPMALEGRDILGTAQTGTGKTAAFAIPLLEKLLTSRDGNALIMAPTREIGKQIMDVIFQMLGPKNHIKTAFIIGGESMGKQVNKLRANPRLIVGTPGRINDHLKRGTMDLSETNFLVLDETDRMLDMGFMVQLETIFQKMPAERQTLMFSATLPKNILSLSAQYLNNPERISAGEVNVVAKNIEQEVIRIDQSKKYEELSAQLHAREGSVIVFVKTKHGADKMAKKLRQDGFTSEALHGDLRQNKRDKVMQNFRKMNFRVLIATDIAARGLDVPHIEHVVNYDLPQVAEDYIHRMGRTARAGAVGSAVSFVSHQDGRKWHAIECLLDPNKVANDQGDERRQGNRQNSSKRKRNHRGGGGKPFGQSSGKPGGKFGGKSAGGYKGKFAGKPEHKFEGKRSDARKSDDARSDFKRSDSGRSDDKHSESKRSDKPYGKPARRDDRPHAGKGAPYKGKRTEGYKGKPKSADGHRPDVQRSDGHRSDGNRAEGKSFAGKSFAGKKSGGGYKGNANKSGASKSFSQKNFSQKKKSPGRVRQRAA